MRARCRRSNRRASRRSRPSRDEPLQASLIALDPATGEVRAIVGGRDTSSVGLNRALQSKRQPGSAFKPFVYAAAIESGYSPASLIDRLNQPIDDLPAAPGFRKTSTRRRVHDDADRAADVE